MELSCVVALTLVSFVSGSPHGYGVKSGAIAKAEANAASGAFGSLPPIPLSIPSGGGFSGSYSKSSSSSFASSSASSSSSSFSFSGTGGNGIVGVGCQSTDCKNGANVAPSLLQGSTLNGIQNSGALASSAAGATAGSPTYTNNAGNLCSSGKCDESHNIHGESQAIPSPNNYDISNNCASGQCGPFVQTGNSPSGYVSRKETGNTNQISNSNSKLNGNGNYGASQSDCAHGKCEPSAQSSTDEQDIFVPLAPSNVATPTYQKPSDHLITPNLGPACTNHNCNQASPGSYSNGKLPTSYSVPILGTSPNAPGNNNPIESLYGTPLGNSGPNDCANGVCGPASTSAISTGSGLQKPSGFSHNSKPSHPQPSISPSCTGFNCGTLSAYGPKVPAVQQPSTCNSPNCAEYPIASNDISGSVTQFDSTKSSGGSLHQAESLGISIPSLKPESSQPPQNTYPSISSKPQDFPTFTDYPGTTGPVNAGVRPESLKPTTGYFPSSHNAPTYNGGFGSPIGSLNNDKHVTLSSIPSTGFSTSSPSYPSQNIHVPSHQSSGTTTGYTNTGSVNVGHQSSKYDTLQPSTNTAISGHDSFSLTPNVVPSQQFPTNSGGYVNPASGTQSGHFYPNTDIITHSHEVPAYTGGFGGPAGPINGNVGHFPVQGNFVTTKPDSVLPAKDKPTYTGGFGAPVGPIDASIPVGSLFTSKPSHDKIPSNTNNLPHASSFGDSTHTTIGAEENAGSNAYSDIHSYLTKPSASLVPPIHNIHNNGNIGGSQSSTTGSHVVIAGNPVDDKTNSPSYTGGFGGPTGLLKPHDYSLPAKTSPSLSDNINNACITGACSQKDVQDAIGGKQVYSSNIASASASASADAKGIAYSGGFGGPPGLLKPFDDGKHLKNEHVDISEKEKSGRYDHSVVGSDSTYGNKLSSDSVNPVNVGTQVGEQASLGGQASGVAQSSGGAQANAGAQTSAGAGANAGAFATSGAFSANHDIGTKGCRTGCGSNINSGIDGSFASSGSLGISKTGLDELNGVAGASASAKSVAGAGVGGLAVGRSFASSSASAHASAGASVKGGYGR